MRKFYLFFSLVSLMLIIAACAPDPNAIYDQEEWDLVWISDSSGWGAAEVYADYVAEDMGVTVNLYDAGKGGLEARRVLAMLRGEDVVEYDMEMQGLAEAIKNAEIVVFYGNPEDAYGEDVFPGDWDCISSYDAYVNTCEPENFAGYVANLEDIYQAIFDLKDGEPVIIRAFNAYNPLVAPHKEEGVFEECRACWQNYNNAIAQAAAAYGVPLADVYAAYNGIDHNEDPREKGYIQSDGEHPNPTGDMVIAQTLRDLGYEVTIPPQ